MSRFFSSVEDERQEGKKTAVREKTYDKTEKQNKKEKRLQELQCKVMELEEETNQKVFEKQLKRMFVDIKKTESSFEGQVPGFLRKFLTSPRVYNKTHKDAVDTLLSRYEERHETGSVGEESRVEEKITRDLDRIVVIRDPEQRKSELVMFKNSVGDVAMKAKALMTLLSMYMKARDVSSVMKAMGELICCFEDSSTQAIKETFIENINFYVETIYEEIDPSMFEMYKELLAKLLPIVGAPAEDRLLQLRFFKLNQTPETDNPLFRLVYINRTQPYADSKRYYGSMRESIGNGTMDMEVLREFGISAFRNGDFETSFETLSVCCGRILHESSIEMRLLCVILNDRIRENPIYKRFLESFRSFGRNRFCLASGDEMFEIYRSFYLLNMYDKTGASDIVRRHCKGFDGSAWFNDFIHSRLIKD